MTLQRDLKLAKTGRTGSVRQAVVDFERGPISIFCPNRMPGVSQLLPWTMGFHWTRNLAHGACDLP